MNVLLGNTIYIIIFYGNERHILARIIYRTMTLYRGYRNESLCRHNDVKLWLYIRVRFLHGRASVAVGWKPIAALKATYGNNNNNNNHTPRFVSEDQTRLVENGRLPTSRRPTHCYIYYNFTWIMVYARGIGSLRDEIGSAVLSG